jgi:phage terminase large subunit
MFETSVVFNENYNAKEDIVVNQGGTSSGKTYSILQVLFTKAIQSPATITVVGQDIPNLKAGALRDALDIYNSSEHLKAFVANYNRSDRIFTFFNGSIMEFKSYDSPQDAKSGKRDYLFINEANGILYQIFDELNTRTKIQSFIDYNPNAEFWVHRELLSGKPNVKLIISDYRHNPFVPIKIKQKIESRKDDVEWFDVYGRGKTGRVEGLVFRNWHVVPAIPGEAKFIGYGLDFGFTNDPTAFIELYQQDGELWINELIYETGLTNQDIDQKLKGIAVNNHREVIADSAEPKSIEELARLGWNMRPAAKGPDSVKNSIDISETL